MAVEYVPFESEKQASDALFNELSRHIERAPGYHDDVERGAVAPYVIMLAGGRTPLAVYDRLGRERPHRVHPALHLMLSDDRHVPAEDERSNYGAIRPMAHALGLPDERFVHVRADEPIETAVASYHRDIAAMVDRNALFGVAILGVGTDGHTASLFSVDAVPMRSTVVDSNAGSPGSTVVDSTNAPPYALDAGEHGGVARVSVSAQLILGFRTLIFFATGAGKRDILYQLSRRPEEYPAGRIMLQHPNAQIWTDEAPRVK